MILQLFKLILKYNFLPLNLFIHFSQNSNSKIGTLARVAYCEIMLRKGTKLGFIGKNVSITSPDKVSIGVNTSLHSGVIIHGGNHVIIGNNVVVGEMALIKGGHEKESEICIGDNCSIGAQSYLDGVGGIEIGNNVLLSPHTVIHSTQHSYSEKNILIRKQSRKFQNVKIEDDVWIGANSTILPGVKIGKGSIIAAGSVVNSDVTEHSVYGGVPAKFIKKRS